MSVRSACSTRLPWTRRHVRSATCGVLALLAASASPEFASAQADKPRPEVLQSVGDGWPIHITYYPAIKDKNPNGLENAPVVVLLHGEGGSRLIWDKSSAPPNGKPFADVLQTALGFAVVTVDLRKHGESIVEGQPTTVDNADYAKMASGDLVAVKNFLVERHEAKELNVNKLGIVAAGNMCPVAAAYAELDWAQLPHPDGPGGSPGTPRGQDVRALVFLSPAGNVGRLNATRILNVLKNPVFQMSFQVVVGTRDAADRNQARSLHQVVSSIKQNEERVDLLRPNTNSRGTDLLANPAAQVEPKILAFLDKQVKQRESVWKTRVSKYDRDTPAP